MQIVGANPDDLDRVAGRISAASRQLSVLERQMTAQLYATDWQGGDADIFKNAWNTRHRRDIAGAVSWLDGADTALRRNAEQQRTTSEADSGGVFDGFGAFWNRTPLPDWLDPTPPWQLPWTFASRIASYLREHPEYALMSTGVLGFFSSNRAILGRYTDVWRTVISAGDRLGVPQDLLRFKRSGFSQWIQPHLHPAQRYFEGVGTAATIASVGISSYSLGNHLAEGEYLNAVFDGGDITSDVLKETKHPVAYVGGVALQSWTEAGRAAQEVDWSAEGMRQVLDASPSEWGAALWDSTKQTIGLLPKIFF